MQPEATQAVADLVAKLAHYKEVAGADRTDTRTGSTSRIVRGSPEVFKVVCADLLPIADALEAALGGGE